MENNSRPEHSQHPPISRRLPLFDVQIFTMPRRACLRGSRRCVGVLFASCSLCVSFRKFKAAVSILRSTISRSGHFCKKTTDLSGSHLVHPPKYISARILVHVSSFQILPRFVAPTTSQKENFPNIPNIPNQFCKSYQQIRRKYTWIWNRRR